MIRGLYTAVSALQAAAAHQQVLAAAMANVNTPGYKSSDVTGESFTSLLTAFGNASAPGTGTLDAGTKFDLAQGALAQTGAPLDLALDGDGFFVLNGPSGPLYTRAGRFNRDAAGGVRSADGFPVQGADGQPLAAKGTDIRIQQDGTVLSDGVAAGKVQVVALDGASLTRAGTATFTSSGAAGASSARVVAGSLEQSNVDPTTVMTSMTLLLRAFEASRQAVQIQNESLNQGANQVGAVR